MKSIGEVMTRGAECVSPSTTIQEAAQKMKDLNAGPLPVCEGDQLVGILTDRDITVRATSEAVDLKPGGKVTHSYLLYNGPVKPSLLAGLTVIGLDRKRAMRLVEDIALDSVPVGVRC